MDCQHKRKSILVMDERATPSVLGNRGKLFLVLDILQFWLCTQQSAIFFNTSILLALKYR
jgi:hypothetical protein